MVVSFFTPTSALTNAYFLLFIDTDRGAPGGGGNRGYGNNDYNNRRQEGGGGYDNQMRGGRNNYNGELKCARILTVQIEADTELLADRGNGNRRFGNFGNDDREEGGYGGGRGNYGRDDRGGREERGGYNNYGGNRPPRGGGGREGGTYERERQVSESLSGLSLEGNEHNRSIIICIMNIQLSHLQLAERDAGRPKLMLAPRSVKDPVCGLAQTKQAAAIFGDAKPREEVAGAEGEEGEEGAEPAAQEA